MAKFGRYASMQPSEFDRMEPWKSRRLERELDELVLSEYKVLAEIAKLSGLGGLRLLGG